MKILKLPYPNPISWVEYRNSTKFVLVWQKFNAHSLKLSGTGKQSGPTVCNRKPVWCWKPVWSWKTVWNWKTTKSFHFELYFSSTWEQNKEYPMFYSLNGCYTLQCYCMNMCYKYRKYKKTWTCPFYQTFSAMKLCNSKDIATFTWQERPKFYLYLL